MLSLADWSQVDGVDISHGNIFYCKEKYSKENSEWYMNNGVDLSELKDGDYDFVMSTIALQHIPVYDIRKNIFKEIYRVMKNNGVFSFQMAYGPVEYSGSNPAKYYDNIYHAQGTNSMWDVRIDNEEEIKQDLNNIGFNNVTTEVKDSYSDNQHPSWIYVRCEKSKK